MTIIGRVIAAGIREIRGSCVDGRVALPGLGGIVKINLSETGKTYGVVNDLRIVEDPLIQQIAREEKIAPSLLTDNRLNRSLPVTIYALVVGFSSGSVFQHRLPVFPPSVLETIETCTAEEVRLFCSTGSFDFLRHILQHGEDDRFDLIAAHLAWLDKLFQPYKDWGWRAECSHKLRGLLQTDPESYLRVVEFIASLNKSTAGSGIYSSEQFAARSD